MLDSLVRVSRRVERVGHDSAARPQLLISACARASSNRSPRRGNASLNEAQPLDAASARCFAPGAVHRTGRPFRVRRRRPCDPLVRFPHIDFKRYFTLFSEYFSSFPRGTFLLLDSRLCLAFDEIYHRIWAAFSNNPTLRQRPVVQQASGSTGLSPSQTSRSKELGPDLLQGSLL